MKARKIAYTLMTLSFIFIISGGVSAFVTSLRADRAEIYRRVNDVNDTFEIFSTNTTIFENTRDTLYGSVFSQLYYDSMYQDDKAVKNKLSNYEQLVDELTKNTEELKELCENVYYPDSAVNARCKNYKNIYEQVVNYFVSDIDLYNRTVKKYNEYQESKKSLLLIKEYSTEKTYIDYNQDNMFDGKED